MDRSRCNLSRSRWISPGIVYPGSCAVFGIRYQSRNLNPDGALPRIGPLAGD